MKLIFAAFHIVWYLDAPWVGRWMGVLAMELPERRPGRGPYRGSLLAGVRSHAVVACAICRFFGKLKLNAMVD